MPEHGSVVNATFCYGNTKSDVDYKIINEVCRKPGPVSRLLENTIFGGRVKSTTLLVSSQLSTFMKAYTAYAF